MEATYEGPGQGEPGMTEMGGERDKGLSPGACQYLQVGEVQRSQQRRRRRRASDVGGEQRGVTLVSHRAREGPVCRSERDQLVKSHGEVWQEKAKLRTG